MADPKAQGLPEGWTKDSDRNAARFKSEHRAIDVELTHDELCVGTQENYRGSYDNTSAFIPLPLLLEMLAAFEYHIVTEADRNVMEAMADAPDSFIRSMESSCEGPAVWVEWMLKVLRAELEARKTRAK